MYKTNGNQLIITITKADDLLEIIHGLVAQGSVVVCQTTTTAKFYRLIKVTSSLLECINLVLQRASVHKCSHTARVHTDSLVAVDNCLCVFALLTKVCSSTQICLTLNHKQ